MNAATAYVPGEEVEVKSKPITLHDLVLYDGKGKPARTYHKVIFDGMAVRHNLGYICKTQDDWVSYFTQEGKELPSLPLLYAALERMVAEEHPGLELLISDFAIGAPLCTSTRIDYRKNTIIHNYGASLSETHTVAIPRGTHRMKNSYGLWRTALQVLLMPKDIDQAVEVLRPLPSIFGSILRPPYIWTAEDRSKHPLKIPFFHTQTDRLFLYCTLDYDNVMRSRGVRVK